MVRSGATLRPKHRFCGHLGWSYVFVSQHLFSELPFERSSSTSFTLLDSSAAISLMSFSALKASPAMPRQ
jgi:hypothetical protein